MNFINDLKNNILKTLKRYYSNLYYYYLILKHVNNLILEIQVCDHCNLNCRGCSHYSPLFNPTYIDIKNLKKDLLALKSITPRFKEVRILGGEPFLNENLGQILLLIKNTFYRSKIIIVTNGILINKISGNLWNLIRENNIIIGISEYPISLNYDKIYKILDDHGIRYEIYRKRNENKWYIFQLNEKGDNNRYINFKRCGNDRSCWQLRDSRIYSCPTAAYSQILNQNFGTQFKVCKSDYIDLNRKISLINLLVFLLKSKNFCRYCNIPRAEINWSKSSLKQNEWIIDKC